MRNHREGGFSLIEVLAALAILSVGLLAVAQLQVSAIRSLAYARHLSTATQLGTEQMEILRSLPFIAPDNAAIPLDDSGAQIVDGAGVSPFRDNSSANPLGDGAASTYHSHVDNPLNALGRHAVGGQQEFYVRWTVERGPLSASGVFRTPGIKQMRIHLQVIWWENNKYRPASRTHSAISGWTEADLRNSRAHWVDLESTRQEDF